jgi:hypothetical protein
MNLCNCELCGRSLGCLSDKRFLVSLDIKPVENLLEPVLPDRDTDPIEMMQQLIESCCESPPDNQKKSQKFHLCSDCYKNFIKDPFGRNQSRRVHFSSN